MYRPIAHITVLIFVFHTCLSQADTINQIDDQGLKQGFWTSYYSDGIPKYEGNFKDNRPIGTMKRYYNDGTLKAKLSYSETGDSVHTQLYSMKGELSAEGLYITKKKHGLWKYYSDYLGIIISEEPYKMGVKEGIVHNYYANGELSEELEYQNDIKNGIWKQYFENGQLKFESSYINGIIDGAFTLYYSNGEIDVEGKYKHGLREGVWTFYDMSGKKKEEIIYINGQPENREEILKQQRQFFDMIEQNEGRFQEPGESIYGN